MTGNVIRGVKASEMSPGVIMRDYLVCTSRSTVELFACLVWWCVVAIAVAAASLVAIDKVPELCVVFFRPVLSQRCLAAPSN